MNFFNIIRKGTNKDLVALQDSAIYEIAAEKLKPQPYAQLAKPLYVLSQYFSVAYHLLSYAIALIGITSYCLLLDSVLQKSIIILLSFVFLAIIEIAKSNSSNTVFSGLARKEQPNKLFLIILLVTTVFSFCTSVWSAKESVYYASTNSKFSNIDSLQNAKIDSINALFSTQISSIQTSIETSQNTLKTSKNKWLKLATNKDLQASQNSLTDVLERKEKAIQSIQDTKTSSYKTTSEKGKEIAIFAAVLFAIFEILNLVSYWFVYQYYQSCLLESSLTNEQNEPSNSSRNEQPKESQTTDVQNLKLFLESYLVGSQTDTVTAAVTNTVPTQKKIGFEFGKNSQTTAVNPKTNTVQLSNGNRICAYSECKQPYIYKVHNQKFCSEKCRINNWNKTTGKTFIKGKGK